MGSCLLRGVLTPSGWPGNPVDTTCPRHQAPSPIPRPCQGHEGWQRVPPPPQSFPGGTEVGVLGGGDTEDKDQCLHPVGEGGCCPDLALLGVWG